MRLSLNAPSFIGTALLTVFLAACQLAAPGGISGDGTTPAPTDAITVTPLDAPSTAAFATTTPTADPKPTATPAGPNTPRPKGRPPTPTGPDAAEPAATGPDAAQQAATGPDAAATAPTDPAAQAEPEKPKSPDQILCENRKGQWVSASEGGAHFCAKSTRDAGKQCSTKTQCEGQCLARSGTCAPITPLLGCNEIFEKDGRRVTLCLD